MRGSPSVRFSTGRHAAPEGRNGSEPAAYRAGACPDQRERRRRTVPGARLSAGDRRSVTDVAMSGGTRHLGRFAGADAALFAGAPRPGVARRASRGAAPRAKAGRWS